MARSEDRRWSRVCRSSSSRKVLRDVVGDVGNVGPRGGIRPYCFDRNSIIEVPGLSPSMVTVGRSRRSFLPRRMALRPILLHLGRLSDDGRGKVRGQRIFLDDELRFDAGVARPPDDLDDSSFRRNYPAGGAGDDLGETRSLARRRRSSGLMIVSWVIRAFRRRDEAVAGRAAFRQLVGPDDPCVRTLEDPDDHAFLLVLGPFFFTGGETRTTTLSRSMASSRPRRGRRCRKTPFFSGEDEAVACRVYLEDACFGRFIFSERRSGSRVF